MEGRAAHTGGGKRHTEISEDGRRERERKAGEGVI